MASSRPCHSPQLYPQIQPCLVSPRHQSHKKVRKSHQSFFQSQRDCSIQPSGCEERATLGKKNEKNHNPERVEYQCLTCADATPSLLESLRERPKPCPASAIIRQPTENSEQPPDLS